ncbi:MAG: HAD hydrolase-like protein [Bacteroidota bacterium]
MNPLLIDLDGVLRINNRPAPNVKEFLDFITDRKINACIVSNSTLSTSEDVNEFFKFFGIETKIPIMTASSAAAIYAKQNYKHVAVYCEERVKRIFYEILDYENPEAVIIGDYGKRWDFKTMNEIFVHVFNGADLIAMQKNRYWETAADGILLDAGPFVAAIEYATNKQARLIGKPSPYYFHAALRILGFANDEKFLMIGDDLETDIKCTKELGSKSLLIYTGKTKYPLDNNSEVKPDYEAMNLTEAMKILESMY